MESKIQSITSIVEIMETTDSQRKHSPSILVTKKKVKKTSKSKLKYSASSKDTKFNVYNSVPSVKKDAEKLQNYALRKSLNNMEPQMQQYKLRKGL